MGEPAHPATLYPLTECRVGTIILRDHMILQRGRPIAEEQARGRDEVERIIQTAQTLGIEVDEADVSQWLAAMAASDAMDWEVDEDSGIYGHEITLLDFDKATLERYRRIADVVQLPDLPNVETAISLAGSAAQGIIQRYPGIVTTSSAST